MFRVSATKKIVAIFAFVLCSVSLFAKDRTMDFELTHTPDALIFDINEDSASYIVTISGPNNLEITFEFDGDETPFIDLFDQEGELLVDGRYNYQITSTPRVDSDIAEMMEHNSDRTYVASLLAERGIVGSTTSGTFTIANGEVVDPNAPEVAVFFNNNDGDRSNTGGSTTGGTGEILTGEGGIHQIASVAVDQDAGGNAQVFTTDLIVQGSGCVGVDCATSESFGFDTIRMKENNLRVHFDDTSASATFPKNDWRLIANESSNGGAEYFVIEDSTAGKQPLRIDAGAGANAIYVENGGHVGFGNSNPAVELHATGGNSPGLRLEQDGSSGFATQSWDLAGNETNFFIRDVTNGSKLPFRIKPGSSDSQVYIQPNGVAINHENATAGYAMDIKGKLQVQGDANNAAAIDLTGTDGTTKLTIKDTGTPAAAREMFKIENNGALIWRMNNESVTGNNWTFTIDSSGNLKISEATSSGNVMIVNKNGNATFLGSVTAAGFTDTSAGKRAIAPAQNTQVEDLQSRIEQLEAQVEARLNK